MSSSEPPADDVPSIDLRSRHSSFAWGESPIRPGDAPELSGDVAGRWTELGRLDALQQSGQLDSLLASGARFRG